MPRFPFSFIYLFFEWGEVRSSFGHIKAELSVGHEVGMSSGYLEEPERELCRDQVQIMARSWELESHGPSGKPQDRMKPPTDGLTKMYLSTELVFPKVDDERAICTKHLSMSVPLGGCGALTHRQET